MNTYIHDLLVRNKKSIEEWLYEKERNIELPIYNSIDIRDAGFKLAPVDNNLFPAGFNNFSDKEIDIAKEVLRMRFPRKKKILILAENHTRNLHYLDNISHLMSIFSDHEVYLSNFIFDIDTTLETFSGKRIKYIPIRIKNDYLVNDKDEPYDLVLLNNDLSKGIYDILKSAKNRILPHPSNGWYNRSKIRHFEIYNKIACDFAGQFNFDPFFITAKTSFCENINFRIKEGIERLMEISTNLITDISKKYQEYGISNKPYLFIKSDKGTYGMGIMTLDDPNKLLDMNKDIRKKMAIIKEGMENKSVIIQEGVTTRHSYQNNSAESMIYMVNGKVITEFLRVNSNKGYDDNLNSGGMYFVSSSLSSDESYANSIIARLSSIAAATEQNT